MPSFYHLGLLLKQQRMKKGYTQAELAQTLRGVHSQFVSNWERGACAPPSHLFQELIVLLKVNRRSLEKAMVEDARGEIREKLYRKVNQAG